MQEKSYIHHEIWYNKEIKIDKKCIFYRQWYERGVRYIHDLTDEYGKILTYENFCQKFNFNLSVLNFYGIRNSIFQRWPSLRNQNFKIDLPIIPSYMYIRIILQNKKNKITVYETFMHQLKFKEKYKDKWSTDLDSCMSKKEWKCINSLPFKITQDTTLRWLQYRIIHRCIATNELLHKKRQKDRKNTAYYTLIGVYTPIGTFLQPVYFSISSIWTFVWRGEDFWAQLLWICMQLRPSKGSLDLYVYLDINRLEKGTKLHFFFTKSWKYLDNKKLIASRISTSKV